MAVELAVSAAQNLGRRWVGIDVTHVAVGLMKSRLRDTHELIEKRDYDVTGEPTKLPGRRRLAEEGNSCPVPGMGAGQGRGAECHQREQGRQRGVDGPLFFHEGDNKPRQVILSVKGGNLKADDIRRCATSLSAKGLTLVCCFRSKSRASRCAPMRPARASIAPVGPASAPANPDHQRTARWQADGRIRGAGINITFKQAPKAKIAVNGPGQLSPMGDE